jgi:hypothetical protein
LNTKDIPVTQPSASSSSGPSRRTALKVGLAVGSVSVAGIAKAALAPGVTSTTTTQLAGAVILASSPPPSPLTTPFLEAMPITPLLPERLLTDPAFALPPTEAPNRAINPATGIPFEGRGEPHQFRSLNPPQKFFAQRFGAVPAASIHPQLQP